MTTNLFSLEYVVCEYVAVMYEKAERKIKKQIALKLLPIAVSFTRTNTAQLHEKKKKQHNFYVKVTRPGRSFLSTL